MHQAATNAQRTECLHGSPMVLRSKLEIEGWYGVDMEELQGYLKEKKLYASTKESSETSLRRELSFWALQSETHKWVSLR